MNALDRIQEISARFGVAPAARPPLRTFADIAQSVMSSSGAADGGTGSLPAAYIALARPIATVAREADLPPELLTAVVWTESSFRPDAVSSAGARGLMQLMPRTADGLGVDPDNPLDNLRGGARYLRQLIDQFGRVDLALAAYNAGPNAVEQYGGIPPYPETQAYVPKVIARAKSLMGVL